MFLVEFGVWIWRTYELGSSDEPSSYVQHCKPHGIPFGTQNLKKCKTLSSLLYRPDDNPVKGRNTVAKYQIYLYLLKSCVRQYYTDT
jgi:hypothetical protein